MQDEIRFETPENIQVAYRPAGLGTRFQAWVIDQLVMFAFSVVVFIGLIIVLAIMNDSGNQTFDPFVRSDGEFDTEEAGYVFLGLGYLAIGLGSFIYFGLSELLMRGQTIGKRSSKIRVVKTDGFALDAPSIFLRNVFRVADQLPPLWLVPYFSPRSQRIGDMVSGTLVVEEDDAQLSPVRAALTEKTAADAEYRFDAGALSKLRPQDAEAIETLLERWGGLNELTRSELTYTLVEALAKRLGVEKPPFELPARQRFLEDLLAAEYRRRSRAL